jgi:two-component system sensor kinase FixL
VEESKARFEALLGAAVDGMVVIDARGIVQVYNPACERLFGYQPGEVVGRNVKMLMPAPYHEQHDDYIGHYHKSGEKRIIGIGREVVGLRKDGSTFPMYLSVGEGKLDSSSIFVGIIRDVTAERAADQSLREREARLRSILETSPDAIIMIDERGIIESFNISSTRLFGYSAQEVIGKNVSVLMPEPYQTQHDGYLSHYRETGEKKVIGIGRIVVGRKRDGSTFPMELAVGEVTVSKRRLFTGFIRDISERQEAERDFRELQSELLHVSRLSSMGEMSAALAHELNQPLTAMTNLVNAARRMMEGIEHPQSAKAREFLDKASAQTMRAGQIIKRLRDFVEKGETHKASEDVNRVVEEAMGLATVGAAEADIRVRSKLAHNLPDVMMDKIQVQQVVLNLVRNAIDAMQTSPVRDLLVATVLEENMVSVIVSDTGPGLDKDVAERLFQPFVSTKENGMGIGLSVCRSIIEAHGGRIYAKPNPEGGVTFRFDLPV